MAKITKKKGNVPEGDVRLAVNMDRKLHCKSSKDLGHNV